MYSDAIKAKAAEVLEKARGLGLTIATAESCTGGLIAGALTEIAGSSDVLESGFVTYSNRAKELMLGVTAELIERHGAVSEPVARAMAEGAQARSDAGLTVAVTGIAGPGGGTVEKPVGLVYMAAARKGAETAHREHRFGELGRDAVREATVEAALDMLLEVIAV